MTAVGSLAALRLIYPQHRISSSRTWTVVFHVSLPHSRLRTVILKDPEFLHGFTHDYCSASTSAYGR